VAAVRHHIVQAVEVPGGDVTVTWSYDPPGARAGWLLSTAAALGLAGLGVLVLIRRFLSARSPAVGR
jgi:hypothetical protein